MFVLDPRRTYPELLCSLAQSPGFYEQDNNKGPAPITSCLTDCLLRVNSQDCWQWPGPSNFYGNVMISCLGRSHSQSSELELSARAEPVSFAVLSWSDPSDCDAEKGPSHNTNNCWANSSKSRRAGYCSSSLSWIETFKHQLTCPPLKADSAGTIRPGTRTFRTATEYPGYWIPFIQSQKCKHGGFENTGTGAPHGSIVGEVLLIIQGQRLWKVSGGKTR